MCSDIEAWGGLLGAELIDSITEAVAYPSSAVERACVAVEIVSCVLDAVSWRLEPNGSPVEELSLRDILTAAELHRQRMSGAAAVLNRRPRISGKQNQGSAPADRSHQNRARSGTRPSGRAHTGDRKSDPTMLSRGTAGHARTRDLPQDQKVDMEFPRPDDR
jgi:hypothetical protein